jgi:hypothetical protein
LSEKWVLPSQLDLEDEGLEKIFNQYHSITVQDLIQKISLMKEIEENPRNEKRRSRSRDKDDKKKNKSRKHK